MEDGKSGRRKVWRTESWEVRKTESWEVRKTESQGSPDVGKQLATGNTQYAKLTISTKRKYYWKRGMTGIV